MKALALWFTVMTCPFVVDCPNNSKNVQCVVRRTVGASSAWVYICCTLLYLLATKVFIRELSVTWWLKLTVR